MLSELEIPTDSVDKITFHRVNRLSNHTTKEEILKIKRAYMVVEILYTDTQLYHNSATAPWLFSLTK